MNHKFRLETTSMSLHILAMVLMLCDHLWATVVPGNDWLTCIGRLAFPIFAFMIVEGYFHTHNLKKYVIRLAICAAVSELPFNLVSSGSLIYPFHQNVLFTFLLGILLIHMNEKARLSGKRLRRILMGFVTVCLAYILGLLTMVDYLNGGLLMILVFYFFRGRKWWCFLGQALLLAYINIEILSGFAYEIHLFGHTFFLVRQGLAVLALIPIWLYRGKQGPYNKGLRWLYYAFYPAHLLLIGLISLLN